ncbi:MULTISPECIES: metalloregulator ArsR/SmtB family transcription factor [Lacrimispora]|uniref:ArsR/SmtB family transcription factor n=1 Tax=Lacrimispora TaxID=2719231 RepID=UPI000BE32550|nr:metalloregulator ArsR/SmtB family transcription factor [Lacrimispora amygdalina]MDK2967072.1 ArsR family transcriptional regulator, arsenate/arsenite/antimonite-responsive transcriptional [Lacrimispora sp.]
MENTHEKNARIFKAFCDEKRLAILELLRSGEKCACVLIDQMEIGQSSLSYHMKILCESGVVDSRPEGKWTHYRLSESGSKYAAELLVQLTTPNTRQVPDEC